MDYNESVQWLLGLGQSMSGYDLAKIKELASASALNFGKLKAIHVAGSNGKGSTCAFISQVLIEAGYKVGLYTSPNLVEPTERIRIDGKNISERKFAALAQRYRKLIEEKSLSASYFEVNTAMALRHFLDEKVDFAVIEVGMGGRLDATNIITPLVSVITSISLEHTQYLGSTITKIAAEKAGIIKIGVPVVASRGNAGINVIEKTARGKNAKLVAPRFRIISSGSKGQELDLLAPQKITGLKLKMLGSYQCENAALATGAIITLQKSGFEIPQKALRSGLEKTLWRGRLEMLRQKPGVLLDAAHNPDGWKKLGQALEVFPRKKLIVVFGAMKDKDIAKAKGFLSRAYRVLLAKPDVERAEEPENLAKILGKGNICASVGEAIESALAAAGKNDLVLVTGSLYVVGEAYRHFGIRP